MKKSTKSEQKRTPKGRYRKQKEHAKRRGIGFKISFDEWWSVWQSSGKYELRGRGKGRYCMCRYNDSGAYEIGNVYIDEWTNNIALQHKLSPHLKNNLQPGARRLPQRKRDIINEMRSVGVKPKHLASLYGVTETTIYNIVREYK